MPSIFHVATLPTRSFLAVFLLTSLAACESENITSKDVVGKFCARGPYFGEDSDLRYSLYLSAEKKYRYIVSSSAGRADVSQAGEYAIYGDRPVSNVELKGICLPRIAGGCGDYPAQVLGEWGNIQIIIRDARGALTLKKCG